MKTLLCVCAALVMALGSVTARAADVTGSWTTDLTTPDGNSFQIQFTFKQDGVALTGSVLGPQGDAIAISEEKSTATRSPSKSRSTERPSPTREPSAPAETKSSSPASPIPEIFPPTI